MSEFLHAIELAHVEMEVLTERPNHRFDLVSVYGVSECVCLRAEAT